MASYQIHRYAVKNDDQIFVDPAAYTENEKQIANNYINFARNLPGRTDNLIERTVINSNTIRFAYNCSAADGEEEKTALSFFREMMFSDNNAKLAYLNMHKSKGAGINLALSYTEVVFANNHSFRLNSLI
jgi:hypothetical protein